MRLFLSWSGDASHQVALVLRDWIHSVVQAVRPYVSSEDIDKGALWSLEIASELTQSNYGILCVTRDNVDSAWLNFEAGALSKTLDKTNVTPFLFRIKRSEVQGPLLQFQSVIYDRDDVLKLVHSINKRLEDAKRLSEEQIQRSFEVWWPALQAQLDQIPSNPDPARGRSTEAKDSSEILEELLELARNQQRLLVSPENVLSRSPEFLEAELDRQAKELQAERSTIKRLEEEVVALAKERDILRLGFRILRDDKVTDPELASLNTFSFFMRQPSIGIPLDAAVDILRSGIEMACADKDFRPMEEKVIIDMAREYGVPDEIITPLIQGAVSRFRNNNN